MIGRHGERGSGISVLAARHDDKVIIYIISSIHTNVVIFIVICTTFQLK